MNNRRFKNICTPSCFTDKKIAFSVLQSCACEWFGLALEAQTGMMLFDLTHEKNN
jgi:hypothetical protein